MANAVNETQRRFQQLCSQSGGFNSGPVKKEVLDLLRGHGEILNAEAYEVAAQHLDANPTANPWYVCFAIGLAWGHLAKLEPAFTTHVVNVLTHWSDFDLSAACTFNLERGPDPIENSLKGAYSLFAKVPLPPTLPSTLDGLHAAQEKWLTPILLDVKKPKYIGSWNATAMFMAALFARPALAKSHRKPRPLLPPGGPVYEGLRMLHANHVLGTPPETAESGDWAGALALNNHLLVDLLADDTDCLLNAHSGVYLLGTRDPRSDGWL
ncbi:hypothetical protein [Dokdonella sp.]|uniref:hypothetical protein n=1 Tax=Dokdonella sp. TaxID=2291710 RepID=UPI0027BADEAA|nr:hypothetical protein [Dokdonella sp.]